ncbi:MAG: hypothetical protein HY290_09860 [Planctomycetia bacterium]|nr:hypothetical protein [Planctomycetia bacterium]
MTPKLTSEMREALLQQPGQPVTVEDDQTHLHYVLLPLSVYQRVRLIFGDESFDVTDTYAAQSAVAGAAGWDDPEMDVYDQYDVHRKTP